MGKNIDNRNQPVYKKKHNRHTMDLFFLCLLVMIIAPWFYNPLTVTSYNLDFAKLPSNFNGFKIAVIADLHSHRFGRNQEILIQRILNQEPDIIVLAGDIIDKNDRDITNVQDLLRGISAADHPPIYSIPGNHDFMNKMIFGDLLALYRDYNINFIYGDTVLIEREGQLIALSSAELKNCEPEDSYSIDESPVPDYKDEFNILLHHYGNEFDLISDEYDLVISGHVHGGLIRFFGRGLINTVIRKPFFPKYSKGVYRKESGSVMVLSAGLGNAIIPRINNPREIVIITLNTL